MPQLVVMLAKQIIKRIDLKQTSIVIGRHRKCDLVLPDRTVSGQHAKLVCADKDCFLEDLNSTNGTYTNHQRIEQYLLNDGDIIGIGKYHLIFRTQQGLRQQLQRLSVAPHLLEQRYDAWLSITNGVKQGCLIPLQHTRITLGNIHDEHLLIEYLQPYEYVLHRINGKQKMLAHKLVAGETLELEDTTFQFHLKSFTES